MHITIADNIFTSSSTGFTSHKAIGYTHKNSVGVGYDTANFSLNLTESEIRTWLSKNPGLDVIADLGFEVWRGFVNSFTVTMGRYSLTKGPLLNVANKVATKYDGGFTAWAEDTTSQNLYGIRPIIIVASTNVLLAAEKNRDWYLNHNKSPKSGNPDINSGGGMSISFECLGYGHYLKYPYIRNTGGSIITISEKIIHILENEPNELFVINPTLIAENTLSEYADELEGPEGLSIIQGMLTKGADSSTNRMCFGVRYRTPYYQEVENEPYYYISALNDTIRSIEKDTIHPSQLKEGRWMLVEEFSTSNDVLTDLGSVFIESVSYTYPNTWSIQGDKDVTLKQRLAKMGLGGY